jgi:4-methylaminobutanoate oxidase (formaldehyde-forming)
MKHDSFSTDDVPLDLGLLRELAAQVADEVPMAGASGVADHRGGLFTMTPDGRFVAGPVPELPGLWVVSGCNGSGFSFSPAIGEALADWIVGDDPAATLAPPAPPAPLAALAPGRFGQIADERLIRDGAWQYAHYYDQVSA